MGLVEVIEYFTQKGELAYWWPGGNQSADIRMGAQLIVQQNQAAVFFRDGKLLDVFGPGRHTLTSMNLPVATRLYGLIFDGGSPFRSSVIFVNTARLLNQKWGTPKPVEALDPKLQLAVRIRGNGSYNIRVSDPALFVQEYFLSAHDGGRLLASTLTDEMRQNILMQVRALIQKAMEGKSVFEMASIQVALSKMVEKQLEDDFAQYGVQLINFHIGGLDLVPEDWEKVRERQEEWSEEDRAGTKSADELARYQMRERARLQKDMVQAFQTAAGNEGTGGSAMGLAMGAGMGFMMPGMMMGQFGYGQAPYGYPPQAYTPGAGAPGRAPGGMGVPPAAYVPPAAPFAAPAGSQAADSIEQKLAKLKSLVEKGLITQEDYEKRKMQILSEI